MKIGTLSLYLLIGLSACRDTSRVPAAAAQTSGSFTPDSTRARELAEFRAGTTEANDLTGGVASLDSLGRTVAAAMMAKDMDRLTAVTMTRAEFAWIYYPTNPQARPPYDLAPGIMWTMLESGSAKGRARATERLDGQRLTYQRMVCDEKPSVEGENRIYGPCTMQLTDAKGAVSEGRIISKVIERRGQWKVVSFANQLD